MVGLLESQFNDVIILCRVCLASSIFRGYPPPEQEQVSSWYTVLCLIISNYHTTL